MFVKNKKHVYKVFFSAIGAGEPILIKIVICFIRSLTRRDVENFIKATIVFGEHNKFNIFYQSTHLLLLMIRMLLVDMWIVLHVVPIGARVHRRRSFRS